MALEHNAATPKSVGDEAVGTGLDIAPLNGHDTIRLVKVPRLTAATAFEPSLLKLCTHSAVAKQWSPL